MSAPGATIPLVLESPGREADGMGGFRTAWCPSAANSVGHARPSGMLLPLTASG